MQRLKVILLAGSMPNFSDEGEKIYRKYAQDLNKLSKALNFDLTVLPDFIFSQEEAAKTRKKIEAENVDFLMFFHPTYISGDIAFEIFKTKADIGLWAVSEGKSEGSLPLASLVCLNQNTSIAGHYFKEAPKKFKWFFGDTKSKYFKDGFEITINALSAIKNLKDSKVAQIGKTAEGFRNMYYDERAIYSNLKVDIVRGIEIEDIIAISKEINIQDVEKIIAHIKKSSSCIMVKEENIFESARFYLALKKVCDDHDFKAVAFSCFPKIYSYLSITGCLVESLMDSIGIPAACEGDMLSALSMLVMSLLSKKPTAVMDMPSFDDQDNSLLLWHCGAAPFEMANSKKTTIRKHYRAEFSQDSDLCDLGPITDIIYPKGDVSVFRFLKEAGHYYYFTGKFFDEDKKSFNGSRGWVKDLYFYKEKIDAIDLINTILYRHIPHHYPIVLDDIGSHIEEFAYWMNLKKIKKEEFKNYLSVD